MPSIGASIAPSTVPAVRTCISCAIRRHSSIARRRHHLVTTGVIAMTAGIVTTAMIDMTVTTIVTATTIAATVTAMDVDMAEATIATDISTWI